MLKIELREKKKACEWVSERWRINEGNDPIKSLNRYPTGRGKVALACIFS